MGHLDVAEGVLVADSLSGLAHKTFVLLRRRSVLPSERSNPLLPRACESCRHSHHVLSLVVCSRVGSGSKADSAQFRTLFFLSFFWMWFRCWLSLLQTLAGVEHPLPLLETPFRYRQSCCFCPPILSQPPIEFEIPRSTYSNSILIRPHASSLLPHTVELTRPTPSTHTYRGRVRVHLS